jgi:hypothetical protein
VLVVAELGAVGGDAGGGAQHRLSRALHSDEDVAAFEQEIVDQYALAMAASGLSDGYVAGAPAG